MQRHLTALALAAVLVALAPMSSTPALAAYKPPSTATAWVAAAADADVDRAFARARAEGKPLLLYWGAEWCPPCNQLKATLFNRQDFIERSKSFVAVHIDGDGPGAQRLGARFKVRGYPTLILFNPAGQEITRLPGEVDAPQVMQVLQLGLAGGRPVKAVLADAQAGKPLGANDWKLLAFYSWETDEQQVAPVQQRAALLARLAAAAPDEAVATRLWLKALAENGDGGGLKVDDALRARVHKVVATPALAREQMDVLVYGAPDIVRALKAPAERPAFDAALARLQEDAGLSRADRQSALVARVELARLDQPKDAVQVKLPEALLKQVREQAARDDREIVDGYERQAVITGAAYMLGRAGLWKESDALLQANLARSHSPYYLMSQLAGNAKKRGDTAAALRWHEQAFDKSEGPATRLQWGATYLAALVDLAPQDDKRIEKAASQLIKEAGADSGAFHERSARSMQKVGAKLVDWNAGGKHDASIKRLRAQLDGVCAKLEGAERATCAGLLKLGA